MKNFDRRDFLGLSWKLGLLGCSVSFLSADQSHGVWVDQTHVSDENFDPDGWL